MSVLSNKYLLNVTILITVISLICLNVSYADRCSCPNEKAKRTQQSECDCCRKTETDLECQESKTTKRNYGPAPKVSKYQTGEWCISRFNSKKNKNTGPGDLCIQNKNSKTQNNKDPCYCICGQPIPEPPTQHKCCECPKQPEKKSKCKKEALNKMEEKPARKVIEDECICSNPTVENIGGYFVKVCVNVCNKLCKAKRCQESIKDMAKNPPGKRCKSINLKRNK